jgi:5'-deoxynucleotidase YfbR-like HD superfamily hydrolase
LTDYSDRIGDWIITYSGKRFYPIDPREEDIDIVDIAHSLSTLNRFTGHAKFPFSVAQHSLYVSAILSIQYDQPRDVVLAGLLHDASEAYVNDLARPLKGMLPEYCSVEKRILDCIDAKFNVYTRNPLVKQADTESLVTEAKTLCTGEAWYMEPEWPEPYRYVVTERPWRDVEKQFLYEFNRLTES